MGWHLFPWKPPFKIARKSCKSTSYEYQDYNTSSWFETTISTFIINRKFLVFNLPPSNHINVSFFYRQPYHRLQVILKHRNKSMALSNNLITKHSNKTFTTIVPLPGSVFTEWSISLDGCWITSYVASITGGGMGAAARSVLLTGVGG